MGHLPKGQGPVSTRREATPTKVSFLPKRVESAMPAAIPPHVPTESSNASGWGFNQGPWEQQGETSRVPNNLSTKFLLNKGSDSMRCARG